MASTYSNRLKLELMETGANANTWGNNTNNNLQTVDAFSAGYIDIDISANSGGTYTISSNNADPNAEASNKVLDLYGTLTGNVTVDLPAVENNYVIYNNTSGSFTLDVAATGGTGVEIPQGSYAWVYCDGTDVKQASFSSNASSIVSGTLSDARLSANVTLNNASTISTGTLPEARLSFTQDGSGAVARVVNNKLKEFVSVKDFGAVGDASTDDTTAIDNAIATSKAVFFPEGIYVYSGTLTLPDDTRLFGVASPKIATFPQAAGAKRFLRPGFKDQMPGSSILFTGTGSISTVTTNRSDRFSSITPMVEYIGTTSLDIKDLAFIQNMDVLNAGGSLTTISTDNRATGYSAGVFLASTPLSSFTNVTLFGYFADAGLIIYSGDDLASSLNPDYNTFVDCLISGGTAIIGHDTAAGAASQALTGQRFIGCGHYAFDHHTRADGNFNIPAIYIDGYISGAIGKIRGHAFTGCNVRTYANDAIVLDHADDIQFAGCVWELPSLSGVSGADASGGFVGTSNTGDLWVFGGAGTSQPKVTDFISQSPGKWVFAGGGHFDGFMVGEGANGVRLSGQGGDSVIQLTDDFTSITTGWSIRKDTGLSDNLRITYDNNTKFRLTTDGAIGSPFGLRKGDPQTISSGVISVPDNGNLFNIATEGGAASDDLDTINGASFEGEIIICKAALSSETVVLKDGGGNLRLAGGDFSLTHGQDRIMLIYDGTNWCEISRANNTT